MHIAIESLNYVVMSKPLTFLCISFYFKGEEFLKSCKTEGNTVYLLTHSKLKDKPWPKESIDEFFFMDDDANTPQNIENIMKGVAWLMRERKIDYLVALDDFDVEKAARFREEFRVPGMGLTTSRFFRDKLSMRVRAAEAGIRVPAFASLFHNDTINQFCDLIPAPWVLKPRSEASATGIKKVHTKDELWHHINKLGDKRHTYLVEQFKPGDVYHTDSLTFNNKVKFVWSSRYLNTPLEVAHGAGIFRSISLDQQDVDAKKLAVMNAEVMKAFGMKHSASHTEFIRCHDDGEFYFLETSSRVGGAHLAVMVEAASGINLWREWARIETAAAKNESYKLPPVQHNYAGILISLARQEWPDQSVFNANEIVWKMNEKHHVGMVMKADNQMRVLNLLDEYAGLVYKDFHASAPASDKPSH